MMRPTFVVRVNALWVVLALTFAAAQAAEPPSPLLGATREQVIERLGEPKSQIVAGNRVVLFFSRERIVLRDGVVVDVERLPGEAPAKMAPPPPPASTETQPAAPGTAERAAPGTTPTAGTATPGTTTAAGQSGAATTSTTKAGTTTTQTETPPPAPKFEIKSVRPPGSPPRPQPKQDTAPAPKVDPPAITPGPTRPTAPVATTIPTTTAPTDPAMVTPGATAGLAPGTTATTPTPEPDEPKPDEPPPPVVEKDKKAKPAKKPSRRRAPSEPDIPDTGEIISSRGNYFITFLVVAAGVGYIVWRYRQRQLALAATAVSHTPFTAPVATKASGVVFNAELLQKLEWKRFEELVASYYSKTGVIAVRTKSGPAAPVHIKISWKGEPRPFAYVQCIPQPTGLIDAKPLQELVNVLAADDIRRGYVVSTGKFSVSARDLAEEKHITLLPGDIFLEKLNALPDTARSELMTQTTTGDNTTPSCPKCEAKMVRAPEDPTMWRCPTHPDQQIPARV